jgi:DNA-binding NarL/FixJ family response regulator
MQRRRTRVADLRLLGLTQNKIAQELGVSEATITKEFFEAN